MWHDPCAWTHARLSLLAGDELTGPDRRRVERHLIVCPRCRERLAGHREALAVLHAASAVEPSSVRAPSLWPALARQIQESHRPASTWTFGRTRGVAMAWATAAGLMASGLALAWLLRPTSPDTPAVVTVAPRESASRPAPEPTVPAAAVTEPPARESLAETASIPHRGGSPRDRGSSGSSMRDRGPSNFEPDRAAQAADTH